MAKPGETGKEESSFLKKGEKNGGTSMFDSRLWDLAVKAMVPLCILLGGTIIGHEVRLGKIEDSRFTDHDGEIIKASIIEAIDRKVSEQIAAHEARPHRDAISYREWSQVLDRLTRIEQKIDRMEDAK